MKTPVTLLALVTACAALSACGGVAPDDVDATSAELTGVEPDEIDCDADSEYTGTANGGVWKTTNFNRAGTGGGSTSGSTIYVGSSNGGVWKSTNCSTRGTGGTAGTVDTVSTGGSSTSGVTYGPVITVKPKG